MFHHNLFACNTGRNPSIAMTFDFNFVNNVLFNWRHRSVDGGDERSLINCLNNYYKPGPATLDNPVRYRVVEPAASWSKSNPVSRWGKAYIAGNVVQGNDIGTDARGTVVLGNALTGVMIDRGAADNVIGGVSAGAADTIANNQDGGVALNSAGTGNLVEGNTSNANGFGQPTEGLGDGVLLTSSPDSTVIDNTIESNRDWGINSVRSSQCLLTGNAFRGNGLGNTHSA